MNRNHVCDICDAEATSWTQIPITEGWLNEDGYPSGRKTSLVICDGCFEKLARILRTDPTVNAEPMRHGHWVMNDNGTYSCSECQSWIPNEQHHYARYCLFCGSKMYEVEEDVKVY